MSLVTELTLSFSDIDHGTAPRESRSIKPHQQVPRYQQEAISRLPQLVQPPKCQTKYEEQMPSLGIQGVGKIAQKTSLGAGEVSDGRKQRKRRQKRGKKNSKRKGHGTEVVPYQKHELPSLPSIQSKSFTKLGVLKDSIEKHTEKTMIELAEYFRSYHGSHNANAASVIFPPNAGRRYEDVLRHTYHEQADMLMTQVIEKDKKDQREAIKQLEGSVLRGQAVKQARQENSNMPF